MAAQKLEISRGASPMFYSEERLDESKDALRERLRKLESDQKKKSPFLIGSIEEVNKKISHLDKKLQSYTALVVESRASDRSESDTSYVGSNVSDKNRAKDYERKVTESKEVNQFAGIYAIKSTFFGKPSERVKNISKISMSQSKTSMKKDSGKPKFVELHQYPGYDATELTPLPNGTSAMEILTKVANAQTKLRNKKNYRPEFERLFYSPMCQSILQDTFWWLFLEKWQSSKSSQPKLFNRVSHNYVKLLTYAKHPVYRDTFLKDFPGLLSQGVYAAFCDAFPDSYRQFNDEFKLYMVTVVFGWVAGISPAPRLWEQWNMNALEPANIKQREEMMNQAKKDKEKKTSLLDMDFINPPNSVMSGSMSTINPAPSLSSMGSHQTGRRYTRHGQQMQPVKGKRRGSTKQSDSDSEEKVNGSSSKSKSRSLLAQPMQHDGGMDPMTPISEFDEDGPDKEDRSKMAENHMKSYHAMHKQRDRQKESHPACRGPDFVRSVFNVQGQSPLVAHFLRSKQLLPNAGSAVLVQRTQMDNLPPLDAPTYKDVMQESYKKVRDIDQKYQVLAERGAKDTTAFQKRQKDMLKEYKRKEHSLLSQQREVKRLSDLIMLELRKDEDSITAGAAQALQTALDAQH